MFPSLSVCVRYPSLWCPWVWCPLLSQCSSSHGNRCFNSFLSLYIMSLSVMFSLSLSVCNIFHCDVPWYDVLCFLSVLVSTVLDFFLSLCIWFLSVWCVPLSLCRMSFTVMFLGTISSSHSVLPPTVVDVILSLRCFCNVFLSPRHRLCIGGRSPERFSSDTESVYECVNLSLDSLMAMATIYILDYQERRSYSTSSSTWVTVVVAAVGVGVLIGVL